MRFAICIAVATVLTASSPLAAKGASFHINNTTWVYVDPVAKVKARESIDAKGNYIENALGGKHLDHGTAVMKDDKVCFTSAMNTDGEECWTTRPTAIGHSMKTTSDKGHTLTVTRVKYVPMKMPK